MEEQLSNNSKSDKINFIALLVVMVTAFILRLAMVIPGFINPTKPIYHRPDTPGYDEVAKVLAKDFVFTGTDRPVGFPAIEAVVYFITGIYNHTLWISLFMVIISTVTVYFVYLAGKEYHSCKAGLVASSLFALNITAIANAPMILSDTYFGLFAAVQFYLFVKFLKVKQYKYFYWSIFVAAIAVLIRPINLVWVMPASFIMCCTQGVGSWKKKFTSVVIAFAIYGVVLLPYMGYNAARDLGWCIDTNTGAMVHQNGAMILAEVKGTDFESEKAIIIAENNKEFLDTKKYPTRAAQEKYRIKKYRKIVLAHPFIWLKQQFKYHILIPDVPTFFEILGVTSAGRGTMGVMAKEGVWKAVVYYFDGKIYLPLMLIPFLLVIVVTYVGCMGKLIFDIKNIKEYYLELLLFLGFAEYYFFLPGAITAPRYQIPALPIITILASITILYFVKYCKEKFAKQK